MRSSLPLILSFLMLSVYLKGQTYCTPRFNGTGAPNGTATSFYTHILSFEFAGIETETAAPTQITATAYNDLTLSDSGRVGPGGKYSLVMKLGNGANAQVAAGWIDFNQDGVFSAAERIFSQADPANVGDHIIRQTIDIPRTAFLGNTRMRIATKFGTTVPDPCTNSAALDWSQHFQDYKLVISKAKVQRLVSLTADHPNLGEVTQGSEQNVMLRVTAETNRDGILSQLDMDSFVFSTLGTTSADDISNARLFYTGGFNEFADTLQLGDSVRAPDGRFIMKSGAKLRPGLNYFWLSYDLDNDALIGNQVDARFYAARAIGTKVPDELSPSGSRRVGYCQSVGSQLNFIDIREVGFANINSISTQFQAIQNGGYTDFTDSTANVVRGGQYTLSILLPQFNPAFIGAWIDFNGDGDLDDAGEQIFDDYFVQNRLTPITATVTIPVNAKIGKTRMRISCQYSNANTTTALKPTPCTNPIRIGEVEDYSVVIGEDGEVYADFSAPATCLGDSSSFTDESTTFGNYSVNSWKWYFGDGDSSQLENPKHLYKSAGVYKVRLLANSNKPGTVAEIVKAVTVEAPKAAFSLSDSLSGAQFRLVDETQGGEPVKWSWSLDYRNWSDTIASPQLSADTLGKVKAKLVVETSAGCKDSLEREVQFINLRAPLAYFVMPVDSAYRGYPIAIRNLSEFGRRYKWSIKPSFFRFANGTNDSSEVPQIIFDSLRSYTITLEVKNSLGRDTYSFTIPTKDFRKPIVSFDVEPRVAKAGQIVSFIDRSRNDPVEWKWLFGDGDGSPRQFAQHRYQDTGRYHVFLRVSNPAGKDSLAQPQWVRIIDEYSLCESSASSSPLLSGRLYDEGGANLPYANGSECEFLIQPDCAGPITLSFSQFNLGVRDTLYVYDGDSRQGRPLHEGPGQVASTLPDTMIARSGSMLIYFKSDQTGTGPGFTANWKAEPNKAPKILVEHDTVWFQSTPLRFENKTTQGLGNRYSWDALSDASIDGTQRDFQYTFNTLGKRSIIVYAENCRGKDTLDLEVDIKRPTKRPEADFMVTSSPTVARDSVKLFDLSKEGPSKWTWIITKKEALGNSTPSPYTYIANTDSTSQNPVLRFNDLGIYEICLIASNQIGTDTVCYSQAVFVLEENEICLDESSQATYGYLYDDGGRFRQPTTGNNYQFSGPGPCTFELDPCASKIYLVIHQLDLDAGDPLRIFDGADSAGIPLFDTIQYPRGYTGAKTDAGARIPDTLIALSGQVYIDALTDHDYNIDRQGFVIEWFSDPVSAVFSVADVCVGDSLPLNIVSHLPHDLNASLTLGNGKSVDLDNQGAARYTEPGAYTLSLKVGDEPGCSAEQKQQVQAFALPEPKITVDPTCAGEIALINNRSKVFNGQNPEYMWQVDGQRFTGAAPKIRLGVVGDYSLKLKITDSLGCKDSVSTPYPVLDKPIARFSAGGNCVGVDIPLINESQAQQPKSNIRYEWRRNGKFYSSAKDTRFFGDTVGSYPFKLVASIDGCADSLDSIIRVAERPQADFSYFGQCSVDDYGFVNTSIINEGELASTSWSFGNEGVSEARSPDFKFGKPGEFMVRLIVKTDFGCADTVTKQIDVLEGVEGLFEVNDTCLTEFFTVINKSRLDTKATYTWYRDGLKVSEDYNPVGVQAYKEGEIDISLVTALNGACKDSTTVVAQSWALPAPDFTQRYLGQGAYEFESTNAGASQYRWYIEASSIYGTPITYSFKKRGEYSVTLTITDAKGCEGKVSKRASIDFNSTLELSSLGYEIYPNPTQGLLTIELPSDGVDVSFFDSQGRLMKSWPAFQAGSQLLSVEGYPIGIYYLRLSTSEGTYYQKIELK